MPTRLVATTPFPLELDFLIYILVSDLNTVVQLLDPIVIKPKRFSLLACELLGPRVLAPSEGRLHI
jgi:hypothetical protein